MRFEKNLTTASKIEYQAIWVIIITYYLSAKCCYCPSYSIH